jgi:hypothetical protein
MSLGTDASLKKDFLPDRHYSDPLEDFKAYNNGQHQIEVRLSALGLESSCCFADKTCRFACSTTKNQPERVVYVLCTIFFFSPPQLFNGGNS